MLKPLLLWSGFVVLVISLAWNIAVLGTGRRRRRDPNPCTFCQGKACLNPEFPIRCPACGKLPDGL